MRCTFPRTALAVRMSATLGPCAVVIWESADDKDLDEPLREVVSSKYLENYGGNVLMSHLRLTKEN